MGDFLKKLLQHTGSNLRKRRIQELEEELKEPEPESDLKYGSMLFLGFIGWVATSAAIGFGLWCVGTVFPALMLPNFILGSVSGLGGWFVFFNLARALLMSKYEVEQAERHRELAELKYEDLKERRLGGGAYQAKGGP